MINRLLRHHNRIMKQKPKISHEVWCDACDRKKVGDGAKCKECGVRHKPHRFKPTGWREH